MTILITTSRRPTKKIRTLAKELERVIPYSKRLQRGKSGFRKLTDRMLVGGHDRLIVIEAYRGNPGRLVLYRLMDSRLKRSAVIHLSGVTLQLGLDKFMSSSLEVEVDEEVAEFKGVRSLHGYLKEFLRSDLYHELKGEPCVLKVSSNRGDTILSFTEAEYGRVVHPKLKVKEAVFLDA